MMWSLTMAATPVERGAVIVTRSGGGGAITPGVAVGSVIGAEAGVEVATGLSALGVGAAASGAMSAGGVITVSGAAGDSSGAAGIALSSAGSSVEPSPGIAKLPGRIV